MFINEEGNKVNFILEDGSRLDTDTKIVGIETISGLKDAENPVQFYDYIMVTGFKADKDQKLIDQVIHVQMDLLKKLKQVCDKYNLQLIMMYGTLLGAVRHEGIIPGDDDIDVALFREDYDKLMGLADEFDGKYFLQTPDTDCGFFGGYSKLRNKETTAIHWQNQWADCCEGIGIDIFPIDAGFSAKLQEYIKVKKIRFYQRLLYAKAYGDARNYQDMPLLIWKGYKYFGMLFSKEQLNTRLRDILMANDKKPDSPMAIYTHYAGLYKPVKFPGKVFKTLFLMKYEDLELFAPNGYKNILEIRYGKDFMHFPLPDGEPKIRHGFYDVNRSYTEYKRHFDSRFKKLPTEKNIVLVGDPLICMEYLKRHSGSHPVTYMVPYNTTDIVFMEDEKLDWKIERKPIEEFAKEDFTKIFPFLCGFDYHKLSDLMRVVGCEDYFFFHYNAAWMMTSDPDKEARKYLESLEGYHAVKENDIDEV